MELLPCALSGCPSSLDSRLRRALRLPEDTRRIDPSLQQGALLKEPLDILLVA